MRPLDIKKYAVIGALLFLVIVIIYAGNFSITGYAPAGKSFLVSKEIFRDDFESVLTWDLESYHQDGCSVAADKNYCKMGLVDGKLRVRNDCKAGGIGQRCQAVKAIKLLDYVNSVDKIQDITFGYVGTGQWTNTSGVSFYDQSLEEWRISACDDNPEIITDESARAQACRVRGGVGVFYSNNAELMVEPANHANCGSSQRDVRTGFFPQWESAGKPANMYLAVYSDSCTFFGYLEADEVFLNITIRCMDEDEDGFSPEGGPCGPADCDDSVDYIHPEKTEVCDGVDNDCDGTIDEDFDKDNDGYFDSSACSSVLEYVGKHDCDDTNSKINPGANEICNRKDDNCNNIIDDINGKSSIDATNCQCYAGGAPAVETCNAIDDDCDGTIDEDFDKDNDSYYNKSYCDSVESYSVFDCNDYDSDVNPGAKEKCNQKDDNCDGVIDNVNNGTSVATTKCGCYKGASPKNETLNGIDDDCDGRLDNEEVDKDNDGYTPYEGDCNDNDPLINPNATELCIGNVDEDCDGTINEGCNKNVNPVTFTQAVCGNARKETGEDCDGIDDLFCPGNCQADCTCLFEDDDTGGLQFPFSTWIIIAVAGIAAAVGLSYWFVIRPRMALHNLAEEHGVPTTTPTANKKPQSVQNYINSALRKGHTSSEIKRALADRGWRRPSIDKLFGEE